MNLCCNSRIAFFIVAAVCLSGPLRALQTPVPAGPAQSVLLLLNEGREAASHGDVTGARAAFEKAMRLQPDSVQAAVEAGALAAGLGNIREAEMFFRRCTELDPGFAKGHYLLGLSLIADPGTRLDWPNAILQFRTALKLQPVYPEASARLGQGLLALNDSTAAIQVLRDASARSPHFGMLLTQLGRAYEAAQQGPQAASAFRGALAIDPRDSDAAVGLAKLQIADGHAEEAVRTLYALLRLNPDVQPAQYVLARALKQTGQARAAAAALSASTRLSQREPNAVEAKRLSNAALQEASAGRLDEAEDRLRRAIRLRPDYGIGHYNLGLILADRQRLLEAQYQLIQAVSLLPGQARPLFDLGRVEKLLGNSAGARREQQWALQLDPSLFAALQDKAVQEHSPLPPALPQGWSDIATAHQQLASDLSAVGDHYGAAGQLQRAVELAPGVADLREALSRELIAAGDAEGARIESGNARLIDPAMPSLP